MSRFEPDFPEPPYDVYVKEEGYADLRFITDKAKRVAYKLRIPNSLLQIGDTFCGEPVWTPQNPVGMYQCGYDYENVDFMVKLLRSEGLIVESEFE